jgi:uncharacterized membrane protein YdjX (TVP38/TMEM64 family)
MTDRDPSQEPRPESHPSSKTKILRWAAGVTVALLLIPFLRHAGDEMVALESWIGHLGIIGPIVFVTAVVLLSSLFVPSSLLSAAAGALFGLGWGACYMGFGTLIAAALNYLMASKLLQKPIGAFLKGHPKLLAIQQAVKKEGWRFQFILRLAPLNAASVNYTLGAGGVRFPPYLLASLGLLPGIFAEVYFGHIASHLSKLGLDTHPHSTTRTALTVAGFLVVVGIMLGLGRMAQRVIAKAGAGRSS